MTDSITNQKATAEPTESQKTYGELHCEEKERTKGNWLFDAFVYPLFAVIGVSVASYAAGREANLGSNKYFEWLRTANKKFASALETGVFSKITNSAESAKEWAKGTSLYWMLGAGGTLMMWPIKALEDNRLKISSKFDEALGTTPVDPSLVEKEPKQSWKSVLAGRAASTITGFTAFCAMGPRNADKISKWFGGHATNAYTKLFKVTDVAKTQKIRKNADMIVFDVTFSVITGGITYLFSRFVAKKSDKDYHEKCDPTVAELSPTPTPDNSANMHTKFAIKTQRPVPIKPRDKSYTEHLTTMAQQSINTQVAL